MCTDADAPGARSPNEHVSVWCGAEPVIEHVPGPAYAGAIFQLTPWPAGSGSDNVTAFAVPVPSAPEFETVTVNPIESPVFTGDASAVLVIARSGQSTVSDADAGLAGAVFVAAMVAELSYTAQLVGGVAAVMCTVRLAPDAKSIS